jgi:hypothetical protein
MWKWVSRGMLLPLTIFKFRRRHALQHHLWLWNVFVEQDRKEQETNADAYRKARAERKKKLLLQRQLEHRGASMVQAIWRGAVDRKFAAFRRTFLQPYVVKIQALYRRVQGKKARRKRVRWNALQEYKAQETDLLQMEAEDLAAHRYRTVDKAVTRLQAMARGKFQKQFAYLLKQKLVRQRGIEERKQRDIDVQRAMKRHEVREEDKTLKEFMVVRIQCLWRQHHANHIYNLVIHHSKVVKYSSIIQCWYRFRQANKERARRLRLKATRAEMRKRRLTTATFMRRAGIKKRPQQNAVRRVLTRLGLYPDTYCGDKKITSKFVAA